MKETKVKTEGVNLGRFSELVGIISLVIGIGLFLYMIVMDIPLSVIASMVITGNPLFYLILGMLLMIIGGIVDHYGWEVEKYE